MKEKEVRRAIASVWSIKNSQALIYDGQFGLPKQTLELGKKVISAVLKSAQLRYSDRYRFQVGDNSINILTFSLYHDFRLL